MDALEISERRSKEGVRLSDLIDYTWVAVLAAGALYAWAQSAWALVILIGMTTAWVAGLVEQARHEARTFAIVMDARTRSIEKSLADLAMSLEYLEERTRQPPDANETTGDWWEKNFGSEPTPS